jgi:hypothetical protein
MTQINTNGTFCELTYGSVALQRTALAPATKVKTALDVETILVRKKEWNVLLLIFFDQFLYRSE